VVLRDKDNTNTWTGTPDGTRESRHYYAQNWRADVSAIVDSSGEIQEWDKYRAYGVPFLLTPGDHNKDGAVAKADSNSFDADYAAGNLRADLNKSGTVTTADQTIFNASYAKAVVGGRFKLSAPDIANRKGYAGYEHDGDGGVPELAHVRHRVLHFGLGRWTRRDPMVYVDGISLIVYARSQPVRNADSYGRTSHSGGQAGIILPEPIPYDPWTPACRVLPISTRPTLPCEGTACSVTEYSNCANVRVVRVGDCGGCTPKPTAQQVEDAVRASCYDPPLDGCGLGCSCISTGPAITRQQNSLNGERVRVGACTCVVLEGSRDRTVTTRFGACAKSLPPMSPIDWDNVICPPTELPDPIDVDPSLPEPTGPILTPAWPQDQSGSKAGRTAGH